MKKRLNQIIKETSYRIKLRKSLIKASMDELKITKEEVVKELQRRCN